MSVKETASLAQVDLSIETHYSPGQISQMWKVSKETVRRLFQNEPGVLILGRHKSHAGKRRYRTLRIPAQVVERVHKNLSSSEK